jgi:hypothetical protein
MNLGKIIFNRRGNKMKLVYEIDNESRSKKCYIENEDGTKEYIDFWNIRIDIKGSVHEFDSWKPQKDREKNYDKLADMRL